MWEFVACLTGTAVILLGFIVVITFPRGRPRDDDDD